MEEKIIIVLRDVNGERNTIEFDNEYAVYEWAWSGRLTKEDEILIIAQGSLCLYSALMASYVVTADDLTGFFG